MKTKCITCNQDKDLFSKEWGYAQCETCSMVEQEPLCGDHIRPINKCGCKL